MWLLLVEMNLLPPRLAEILRQELAEDEKVVWAEMPEPRGFMSTSAVWDKFLFGAFLIFCSALVVWQPFEKHASNPLAGWEEMFLPCAFAIVGMHFLLAPLWSYLTAKQSVYAITDRRAIIIHALRGRTTRSFNIEWLDRFERQDGYSGRGSIIFDKEVFHTTGKSGTKTRYKNIGFLGLCDVGTVDALLRATSRKASASKAEATVGKN